MDLHELEKMTVTKLREEAHKFEDVKGASGMSKERLIDLLCEKHGIVRKTKIRKGIGRRALKEKISSLKGQRDAVLESGDRKAIRVYRRRVKSVRRHLRKVIDMAAREAAKKPAEKEKPAEG